ncbi:MAG: ABC transporter permease [Clostridiales Family XIII bacterium]|jgi:ABC-2 type transport system permease protein|nr:ABC transporter permease [Clostridiales Family XIII bacterium]
MRNLKNVCAFEYNGYINSKSFRTITAVIAIIILLLSFIPRIAGAIDKAGVGGGAAKKVVIVLSDDIYKKHAAQFTPRVLKELNNSYTWTLGNVDGVKASDLEALVKKETYKVAVYFDGSVGYKLYVNNADMLSYELVPSLDAYITGIARADALEGLPPDTASQVTSILSINAAADVVSVATGDRGGDAGSNFWLGYVLVFFLFYVILAYGNMVITSVITEKSTRAMELLIVSVKPTELMFGKVLGVGLAALTQVGGFLLAGAIGIFINTSSWESFSPAVTEIIDSLKISPLVIVFLILFFLLGYFLYAFIYAALGSTVSKIEEASSVTTIPTMFLTAAFIITMIGSTNASSTAFAVLSYIPFFSPFVMFSRYCMGAVSAPAVCISLGILFITIVLFAILGGKIYRTGVMMYGKPMSLKSIWSAIRTRN